MPKITRSLHDSHFSVTRRCVIQMMKHFLADMNISYPVKLRYKGTSDVIATYGSEYDHKSNDPVDYGADEYLEVELRETISGDQITQLQLGVNQYPAIWQHDQYAVRLDVEYIPVEWVLSFKYLSSTPERVEWFKTEVAKRIAFHSTTVLHAMQYLLTPHKDILHLLSVCYNLENKVYPTELSRFDWLKKYSAANSAQLMTNAIGRGGYPVFSEVQTDVVGVYDLVEIQEQVKRDQNAGGEESIEMIVRWSRPDMMTLHFPVTIFNQKIPDKYIPRVEHHRPGKRHDTYYEKLQGLLLEVDYETFRQKHMSFTARHGIVLPIGDDWVVKGHRWLGRPVFTGLVKITQDYPVDPIMIATHKGVSQFMKFGSGLLRYLQDDPRRLVRGYDSVLNAIVAIGDVRVDSNHILVDKSLDIKMHYGVSRKDVVHVSYSVPTDYRGHSEQFFKEVSNYPDMIQELFHHIEIDIRKVYQEVLDYLYRYQIKPGKGDSKRLYRRLRYPLLEYSRAGIWDEIEFGLLFDLETFVYSVAIKDRLVEYLKVHYPDVKDWLSIKDQLELRYRILQGFKYWVAPYIVVSMRVTEDQYWGKLDVAHVTRLLLAPMNTEFVPIESLFSRKAKTVMRFSPRV